MQANHTARNLRALQTPPLPYSASLHAQSTRPMRAVAPATVERPLLELLPPVPARPLPRRLDPRRAPWRKQLREEATVLGLFVSCLWPAGYAIAQILGAQ